MTIFAVAVSCTAGGFGAGIVFGSVVLGPRVYLTGRAARGPAYGPAPAAPGITAHAQADQIPPQRGGIPVTVTVIAAPQIGPAPVPAPGSAGAYGEPQTIRAHEPGQAAGIDYRSPFTSGTMISNRPGQAGTDETTPQESGRE